MNPDPTPSADERIAQLEADVQFLAGILATLRRHPHHEFTKAETQVLDALAGEDDGE